jgi:fermentation-respiration switch protein FrsA (DUF1100 family)
VNHPRAIHIVKTALSLRLRVAQAFLQERLGERASDASVQLAAQIDALVRTEKLGYYPALDYFANRDGIDRGLLAEIEEAARWVRAHAEQQVRARLWPAFSHVRVVNTQSPVFALPGVRPGQSEALAALARHYTPTVVKIDLVVSSLKKGAAGEGAERAAAQQARWWLRECFESVEVSDARVVAE